MGWPVRIVASCSHCPTSIITFRSAFWKTSNSCHVCSSFVKRLASSSSSGIGIMASSAYCNSVCRRGPQVALHQSALRIGSAPPRTPRVNCKGQHVSGTGFGVRYAHASETYQAYSAERQKRSELWVRHDFVSAISDQHRHSVEMIVESRFGWCLVVERFVKLEHHRSHQCLWPASPLQILVVDMPVSQP